MSNLETSQSIQVAPSRLEQLRDNNKARLALLGSVLALSSLALNACGNTTNSDVNRSYLYQDTQTSGNPTEDFTSQTP